ncbi:uncharacterized protein A4U43_C01F19370 [Asparagus officinalis]|uniref:Uncharacterized protein n=1 Tax=Asparagus officinalis TaxID=4686 RepID=A0A5P1FT26_ASPOF|nr:uncharacterized protein LOC109825892 [Asparagus officinalis]ONK80577.1 uncharacterized protein A4U43_C01F19370 [Asparagus officinalis]
MAASSATLFASCGTQLQISSLQYEKLKAFGGNPCRLGVHQNSKKLNRCQKLSVTAKYSEDSSSGGGDFLVGFLLGGAVFGTLAYVFAPQIRRTILNEDEYGFRKAKRPVYYDEGLEKTRQTLNAKISQLNSAIDNVSSRLRGGNKAVPEPVEADLEVEATM